MRGPTGAPRLGNAVIVMALRFVAHQQQAAGFQIEIEDSPRRDGFLLRIVMRRVAPSEISAIGCPATIS